MLGATVAVTSSRALVDACRTLGADVDALLEEVGLAAAELEDPDARLPGATAAALFQRALVRSGDPALPLRAAEAVPFGAYKVIDFLAASAPTVGEGLSRVARYFPLINSTVELKIRNEDGDVRVALENPRDPAGVPRPYAEYALAVTVLHCRHAAGFAWPLSSVSFAFPRPERTSEHERVFGCPVAFGAVRSELVVASEVWAERSRGAGSSALLRVLEQHAEQLLATLRGRARLEVDVATLLTRELRGGSPTLETVARELRVTPRTLQRRLRAERTSFAEVLDRARRSSAAAYVADRGLALTEVAYLLGFSEQSAFTRAFHRWFGVPPSQYRTIHA